jgi:tonB family C-terminal domain
MSKVDIISREWCDLVFEGRNKSYGAYDLRSKAGRRHLYAIIDILVGIAVIAGLIFTYAKAKEAIQASLAADTEAVTELRELKKDVLKKEEPKVQKQEEQPKQEQLQKVAVRASVGFTVPDIVDKVDESKKVKNQDELNRSNLAIATGDYAGDANGKGTIDDLLKGQEAGGDAPQPKQKEEEAPIHTVVEQPAQFPGGEAALLAYVAKNIKYPAIAVEQEIQGTVQLRFVVEANGSIGDVQVVKSLESHCDKEAVRVVKSLPRFIPGKQQGRPVRVWFNLPVRYSIQN